MVGVRKKAIIGCISFLFLFLTALFVGAGYETNDDAAIAFLISKGADAGAIFQHKWLVCFLNNLFDLVPTINWWTVFSVFSVSVGFAIVCILVAQSVGECNQCYLVMAGISCVVYETFIIHLNFTKTAAMPLVAANALAANIIRKERFVFSPAVIFVYLLYIVGAAIRKEVALLGIAFLGMTLCWQLFYTYRYEGKRITEIIPKTAFCLSLALVVIFAAKVDTFVRTEEETVYSEYNTNRVSVQDYSGSFPDPDANLDIYVESGYRINDVKAIFSWIDNDTENITAETFSDLAKLKENTTEDGLFQAVIGSAKSIVADYNALFSLAAVFFVCIIFCISDPITNGIKTIAFFMAFFSMIVYFKWRGRLPNRVLDSCVFLLAGSLLLSPFRFNLKHYFHNSEKNRKYFLIAAATVFCVCFLIIFPKLGRLKRIAFLLLLILFFAFIILVSERHIQKTDSMRKKAGEHSKKIGFAGFVLVFTFILIVRGNAANSIFEKQDEKPVLEYIDQNDEKVFIVPVLSLGASVQECKGIWKMAEGDYCANLLYLGGWDSRSPAYVEMRKNLGIENPMRALIEEERVYSVETKKELTTIILNYLRDHFDESTTYTRVSNSYDRWFIHYQKAIDPAFTEGTYSFDLQEASFTVDGFMKIKATTDFPGTLLYCNVKTTDGVKTYSIVSEDGNVTNELAELGELKINGIEAMTFFAQTEDEFILLGEYSKEKLVSFQ